MRALPALAPSLGAPAPDRARAVAAVRDLLDAVGVDVAAAGLGRTPERVADLYLDLFAGLRADPAASIGVPIAVDDDADRTESVRLAGIPFRSVCEQHLMPFEGVVDVAYTPRRFIAGFGRIAALVRVVAQRPGLQERMGRQIAAAMAAVLDPHDVEVRIEARHSCIAHVEPGASSIRAVTTTRLGGRPHL
jgi:GTP cyclohydrolase IA